MQLLERARAGVRARRRIWNLALDSALERLRSVNERHCRVVELRVFGGLTVEEVGAVLGLSRATVSDDWAMARAWLACELSGDSAG